MLKKIINKLWRSTKAIIVSLFWYPRDLLKYWVLSKYGSQGVSLKIFPQIFDRDPLSHTFDKHYVYMDRWAFKKLLALKPEGHVDVGSSVRFLSMATTITRVKFLDIRPIKADFENFECVQGSILRMPFADNSVESLSCLHVAEHIGLGRYGDPLDPQGTQKACQELLRVLKPGGRLYFALPIGKTATYFNAHRVHSPKIILEYFRGLKLLDFAAVDDRGGFINNARMEEFEDSIYACGMFEFSK